MEKYFKVELQTTRENSKHIEKDFFKTEAEALAEYKTKSAIASTGFYRAHTKSYIVILAEVFPDEKRTVIHKISKAPQ